MEPWLLTYPLNQSWKRYLSSTSCEADSLRGVGGCFGGCFPSLHPAADTNEGNRLRESAAAGMERMNLLTANHPCAVLYTPLIFDLRLYTRLVIMDQVTARVGSVSDEGAFVLCLG
jgi:hypothetical protein